ncbi:MAG: DUF6514 family protein [Clostridia bacterium]
MDKKVEMYGNTTLTNSLERKNLIELEYYKICNNLTSKKNSKPYGLGVIKKSCNEIELNMEKREFNNIFTNENDANKMLNLLLKNKVTPVALKDVLEDFVLI